MPFKKGQSGNPKGAPPKNRAWTKILEAAGNKTETLKDGRKVARKRIIAELALQAASTGVVTFPDGTTMELSVKDWMDMLWKVYGQVDGPPKAEVDLTSGGEPIQQGPQVYLPVVSTEDAEGQ